MHFKFLIFSFIIFSNQCFALDRALYTQEITLRENKEVLKTVHVQYTGTTIQKKLLQYAGGRSKILDYLENFLPFQNQFDTLLSRKALGHGRYEWQFKGQDLSNKLKINAYLLLPPLDDPVLYPWKKRGKSNLKFNSIDLEVTHQMTIHFPWKIELSNEKEAWDQKLSQRFLDIHYNYKISDKQKNTLFVEEKIYSKAATLSQKETNKIWSLWRKWQKFRKQWIIVKFNR